MIAVNADHVPIALPRFSSLNDILIIARLPGTSNALTRRVVWRQALHMEKWGYQEAHDRNLISPRTFDRLSLMLNLKRDAIAAGQIPPPVLESEDLEGRLERRLIRMGRWLRAWGPRGRRQADRALQDHFKFDLAVAFIGKRVTEELRQLSQQLAGQLDPALFEACAAWYTSTSQGMFQRLKAQEDEHPELFQAIQRHVLNQATQASARQRLEKLLTDGIISRAIVEKVELMFDEFEESSD